MKRDQKDRAVTLKELISNNSHSGFRLAIGYYVELDHGLMGTFPAIESESREMILTTDRSLIRMVWKTLTPRRSKLSTQLLYVNAEGIAYSVGTTDYDLNHSQPYRIFDRKRFKELTAAGGVPFQWQPGLVGNDMTRGEFRETLQAAMKKIHA